MKLIGKIIFAIASNVIAILVVQYFLPHFFSGSLVNLLSTAFVLTVINELIKPILKFISAPFIVLTFGLFTIVINAISVYLLDFFSQYITIQSIKELVIASLVISLVNFILETAAKKNFKKD